VGGIACQDVANGECKECETVDSAVTGVFFEGMLDEVYVVRDAERHRGKFHPRYAMDPAPSS
jgi:hypothetical protein